MRKWAANDRPSFDDLLLELLRGPVKVISFVILLHVGLRMFAWPDWRPAFISNGLKIIVACSLTYVGLKCVDLLMGVWQQRVEASHEGMLDMHLFPIIRKTLKIFVLVVAVLVTSQNLGMNVTGLLASLSIGGLAVGLAAQDTLSNLFGAVAIFADKPFRVGDRIQLDSDRRHGGSHRPAQHPRAQPGRLPGHHPEQDDGQRQHHQCQQAAQHQDRDEYRCDLRHPLAQIERAMEIIEEIYRPHPKTADLLVSFNKFDSSALNILVVHWWNSTDFKDYLQGFQKLNLELKRRFDAERHQFRLPQPDGVSAAGFAMAPRRATP